jgi:hypothetical protein
LHRQRLKMSEQPKPKKTPRKARAKKVVINKRKSWQDIVNGVDKKEVPITILQYISVQLVDGTSINIDIKQLIDDGQDPTEIEELLDAKFQDLDEYIENVDFFIDIDKVVNTVQPETDKVLKDL